MHECLKVFRHNVNEYLARKACFNTSVFLVFYAITDALMSHTSAVHGYDL